MNKLVCQFQGRFGNSSVQYLFARAYAEKHRFEFHCDEWIGERIFDIPSSRYIPGNDWPRYNEAQLAQMTPDHSFVFRGYAQTQFCASHYSKRQAQAWFRFKQEIIDRIGGRDGKNADPHPFILAHRRVGDYKGYGYVQVSEESYDQACEDFCLSPGRLIFVTEEKPFEHPWFSDWAPFLPDFFRMVRAPVLLRGNSTFSWLAALIGNGLVLAPVIDGLEGGKEHHCKFVAGNHPRLANLDFTETLYVAP